jgi:hypothetical protein
MVLTYSPSGEPERLWGARGLKYVYQFTWGTDVSQVKIVCFQQPRALGGSRVTT